MKRWWWRVRYTFRNIGEELAGAMHNVLQQIVGWWRR